MPAKPDIPWRDIETEYVTGDMSLAELAESYKDVVSDGTIKNHSYRDDWVEKRRHYKETQIKLIQNRKLESAIRNRDEFDDMVHRSGKVAVAHAANKLTKHHNGELDKPLTDTQIKTLLAIVADGVNIMYRVWDIPLPKQRIETEIIEAPADNLPLTEIEMIVDRKIEGAAMLVDMESNRPESGNGNGEAE